MTKTLILVALCGSAAAFYAYKKGWIGKLKFPKTIPSVTPELKTVEGILSFQDVVAWFKNIKGLDKNVHTPFIANAGVFKQMIKCNYTKDNALLIGVYDEKRDDIVECLLVECDVFDKQTLEVLGKESIVVLS